MGRSVSLFLVRGAGILAAGMLLFAVLGHAHAENLDGYGIKPVAGAPDAADYGLNQPSGSAPVSATPAAAAANNSYNAAPVGGGYYPPAGNGYYPTLASGNAPMPGGNPSGGYAPAPPGYTAGPPPQPAPAYQPPPVQPQYSAPSYPTRPVQPIASTGAYGYRNGDGISDAALAGGSYPIAYQSGAASDYVLGTGDKLKLTVFDETDLSGDYTVDSTGFVRLPLIGQVRAAGLTSTQLEGAIGGALAQGYLKSPRVSVAVTTYRPFYIIGAVNRPGEYPYVDHMNALNAIALAGGYTTTAVESAVYVRREGSNQEIEMPTDRTTAIHPGDVVRVHNTIFSEAMSLFSPLTGVAGIAAAATIH
jgi:protein involved in polysaccharide export with SLBB domain